ncbi:hypothetical protein SH1V18_07540 [Vallitalea longa]|uniref:DUF4474 domain-containing protein n=1 Tax=Vallitalea longa TaxID=2936439 RepID=A0A9W5Y883_9FIRM|nr:hypothetical protein [Vallitalea longa]GKX28274.1 hypothetical protein SH1V18_07540 [Vallitalea longa]
MGYTKYDLDRLNDTEKDLKRITENIDSKFDEFKEINNTIDIDIKLRDNIYDQFKDLMKDFEYLVERTYNADKLINSAIFEYSNGEQKISTLFNGFVDIANMFHDENKAQTQSAKTSITGINIIQKWFKGLKDYFKSKINHIKNFLDVKEVYVNNKDYFKTKNNKKNSDIKIGYLSISGNNFEYTSQERIKQIQQFIKNKGINIDVTGELDRATLQASLMVGIDELKDNGFIQEDNFFRYDMLNFHSYIQNNRIMYVNPSGHDNDRVSNEGSSEDGFDLFNIDPKDVTRNVSKWLIGNPVNVFITQHPYLMESLTKVPVTDIFYAAGFVMDDNGVYHARQDALQQIGGYNDFYDIVFDYATSMKKERFEFSSGKRDYVIWTWKGDYLNLGSGAELGIYSHDSGIASIVDVTSPIDDHWLVDTSLAMPMTLTLKDKNDNIIADYNPGKDNPQWWITAFNPYEQNVNASNLTVTYTIDFTGNKTMFDDFITSDDYLQHSDSWSSAENNKYLMTYEFK